MVKSTTFTPVNGMKLRAIKSISWVTKGDEFKILMVSKAKFNQWQVRLKRKGERNASLVMLVSDPPKLSYNEFIVI